MTEYLYDKENPKSRLRYKPQGWESFYRGMPNNYERAELIGRYFNNELNIKFII
jgi:hypothetical protein